MQLSQLRLDAPVLLNTVRRIMEWIVQRTKHYPDVSVTDFTDTLADGKAFLAILENYDPDECSYEPSDSPSSNLRRWVK